eukprot:13999516-Heterocapsa_arctica.AAC.1
MENIMHLGWSDNQEEANSISEAIAKRRLLRGSKQSVASAATWMHDNAISTNDITGQSHWAQAVAAWGPFMTIGCSVPHFLRHALPAQVGP